jgi:RNA polymerase sigma-70 factor (ECF subfamily)
VTAQLDELSDRELMRGVASGHTEWFAVLVRRYQGPLLRVAHSRLGRRDWAEDVVQEAFLAAFRWRHTFRPEANIRTWLWTILLNQCHRHYRRRARRPRIEPLALGTDDSRGFAIDLAGSEPSPLARLLQKERSERIDALLAQLTEPQADALRLRFFGGLKFQEIADTMGCALVTAKNRVRYGLARMAQLLAQAEAADSTTGDEDKR